MLFSKEDSFKLDGQSKICNWLYNYLLDMAINDYSNGNEKKLLTGRNLRDTVPGLKEEFNFLKAVHSSPLKNTALRLKEAYDSFFNGKCNYPKYRSWRIKWFSLFYDEPQKGFRVQGKNIRISLGQTNEGERLYVTGRLVEELPLKNGERIKNFRLCKEQGDIFYAIFTIERRDKEKKAVNTWIAIDPNHKNLFAAVDNEGRTYEFEKPYMIKYWDNIIDELKGKRDKCEREAKKRVSSGSGKEYFIPSRRWTKLNAALNRAYHRRREQIKSMCYVIGNFIAKNYDYAAIGDYVPSTDTASEDMMHRSMLNQTVIGKLRETVSWVMERSCKSAKITDEKNTTKLCCICGYSEAKSPDIREFQCSCCGSMLYRDINSAVNIAVKEDLIKNNEHKKWNLDKPQYVCKWSYKTSNIITNVNE